MEQIKNQKFDIIVGIPTYNEVDSIANTTQKISRGLIRYFPKCSSLIVNLDSKSTDETRSIFLSTKTKITKASFTINKQPRGKGANIFSLLKLSKEFGAKYIATIDADITTITEKWPKLLLDPIIKKEVDFVSPIYTRNRYEGNTTNHFCFPLLYTWFGQQLNQPIGGDFAMSSRFAEYILDQQKPKNSYFYGIDIFLSTHAIGAKFKIKEVYLGRKIHKPSFDKIIPMFQQVAATMIFVLSQYKDQQNILKLSTVIKNRQRIDSFIRKPDQTKIVFLKKHAFQNLQHLSTESIQKYFGLDLKWIKTVKKSKSLISGDEWIKIMANLSNYITKHSINNRNAVKIAKILSPFFFLRVLMYFEELDKSRRQKNIDTLIFKQAEKLRKLIISSSTDIDFSQKNGYDKQNKVHSKSKRKEVEKK